MSFVFRPVTIIGGLLAGMVASKVFDALWGLIDDEEAPRPKHREIDMRKMLAALLIEGAIFRLFRGYFDHFARRGFWRMTGSWPGEERPEPK
jgi:Protein of unknown function (DUF4235)